MDAELRKLLLSGAANRQTIIHFPNGEYADITSGIYSGSMKLEEVLCSSEDLTFGECNASKFEVTLSDTADISNLIIEVYQSISFNENALKLLATHEDKVVITHDNKALLTGRHANYTIPLFYGRVDSAELQADRIHRDIIAYDELYFKGDINVADWYSEFFAGSSDKTLKSFRYSLFEFIGIQQENITLINDNIVLEETLSTTELKFSDLIKAICQINVCFGHINRNGIFKYIYLSDNNTTYDISDNYRSNDTSYEQYFVRKIDKLQISGDEEDIGAIVGTGDNPYTIKGNFLIWGKTAAELEQITNTVFAKIKDITYRPFSAETIYSEPYINIGDILNLTTSLDNINISSYVLQNSMSGVQLFNQELSSTGSEYRSEVVDDVNAEINQLKGRTLKLTKNVDKFSVEMEYISGSVDNLTTQYSKIEQQTDSLTLTVGEVVKDLPNKVTVGEVSSQLSLEKDKITISGQRLEITTDNFTLATDGTVSCSNITITGGTINITASSDIDFITLKNTKTNVTTILSTSNLSIADSSTSLNIATSSIKCTFGDYGYVLSPTLFNLSYLDSNYFELSENYLKINTKVAVVITSPAQSYQASSSLYMTSGSNMELTIEGDARTLSLTNEGMNGTVSISASGTNSKISVYSNGTLTINTADYFVINSDTTLSILSAESITIESEEIILGKSSGYLGFFGHSAHRKETIEGFPTVGTPTTTEIRDVVRDLYNALSVYGLISIE